MNIFHDGERIHLVDKKNRHYAVTLKAGDSFQLSGETIGHDTLIGKPDGTLVTLSAGRRLLALRPTLSEYVLKMPRGAQVLYPKDLGVIIQWADIYPGARVFEAGTGSGALTMALLRAVGERGHVYSYEAREDFAETAMKNIYRYMGAVTNLTLSHRDAYQGIELTDVDRVILDLPEPWQIVPHAASTLRSGGVYLSYVPTIPQVMQTVEALNRASVFAMIQTFETLLRTWNIEGRSVRPDHRMVAHSGFLTVARKVQPGLSISATAEPESDTQPEDHHEDGHTS